MYPVGLSTAPTLLGPADEFAEPRDGHMVRILGLALVGREAFFSLLLVGSLNLDSGSLEVPELNSFLPL